MKKLIGLLGICLHLFFISSCNDDKIVVEEIIEENVTADDVNNEVTAADTSSTGVYQEKVSDKEVSLKEAMQAEAETKVEVGTMSFCDCVKKNKELTDTMMGDNATDAQFDEAMAELEKMKTGDCKIMFPDQSNIDEVNAHKLKVKKCLK